MRLGERKHCFIIEDVFPDHIVCGYTKRNISGKNPLADFEILKEDFPEPLSCACMQQLHSPHVCTAELPGLYQSDGLVSDKKNLMLIVKTADCLPLLAYDFSSEQIAAIHLGWRPALKGILQNITLDLKNTSVIAGAGLRSCCYEVGSEFRHFLGINAFIESHAQRLFFNPIAFVVKNLEARGMRDECFYDLGQCSFCNDDFYSFRRERTDKRTLSFIFKK